MQESKRLAELRSYAVLDSEREREFDDIVDLLAAICDVPIALVSLVDADRQWFKAETGLCLSETPIEQSICARVMNSGGLVEIPDTRRDPRSRDNPLVTRADRPLLFYAGAPLASPRGAPLGMLCILDYAPRELTDLQRRALMTMAAQVVKLLEFRRTLNELDSLRHEVDHRVKNSLASIEAAVRIQAKRSASPEVREALAGVSARLASQSALHDLLQRSGGMDEVDLASLLKRLSRPLAELLPAGVVLSIEAEPLDVGAERANVIALVANEFVTNSAKHGFPDSRPGRVSLQGRVDGDDYVLTCRDDGVANSETVSGLADSKGLGMRVIGAVASSLGRPPIWSCSDPGLCLELRFAM